MTDSNQPKKSRISVDLPAEDHVAFKVACTKVRAKMNDEIRKFIVRRTAELEKQSEAG